VWWELEWLPWWQAGDDAAGRPERASAMPGLNDDAPMDGNVQPTSAAFARPASKSRNLLLLRGYLPGYLPRLDQRLRKRCSAMRTTVQCPLRSGDGRRRRRG
jgi:hypothetical protein